MRINKSDNDHNTVTGIIPKSYLKISEQHGWKAHHHGTTENSHIGYTHILWEVLVYKYNMFIMRNNITCARHCNHRTAATLYGLET